MSCKQYSKFMYAICHTYKLNCPLELVKNLLAASLNIGKVSFNDKKRIKQERTEIYINKHLGKKKKKQPKRVQSVFTFKKRVSTTIRQTTKKMS